MNNNNGKLNQPFQLSEEFPKSPFPSSQENSPAGGGNFSPFKYTNRTPSPNKYSRKAQMRYFNNSNTSTNSSASNGSPFKYRNNRHGRKDSRGSLDSSNISLYYDATMMENPWADLEKNWEERKQKESLKSEK